MCEGKFMNKVVLRRIESAFLSISIFAFVVFSFGLKSCSPLLAAEKLNATQLIELAKSKSPGLHDAVMRSFEAKDLKEGKAWAGLGPDFFFATEAASEPALFIDEKPGPKMQGLAGSNLWYAVAHVEPLGESTHFITRWKAKSLEAALTCLRLDRCPTCNRESLQESCPTRLFTPARFTTE